MSFGNFSRRGYNIGIANGIYAFYHHRTRVDGNGQIFYGNGVARKNYLCANQLKHEQGEKKY